MYHDPPQLVHYTALYIYINYPVYPYLYLLMLFDTDTCIYSSRTSIYLLHFIIAQKIKIFGENLSYRPTTVCEELLRII